MSDCEKGVPPLTSHGSRGYNGCPISIFFAATVHIALGCRGEYPYMADLLELQRRKPDRVVTVPPVTTTVHTPGAKRVGGVAPPPP